MESEPVAVAAGETETVEQVLSAVEPALWSVDDPNLYNLVTEILVDGVVTDRYESRFGFRWTEFTVNDGFLLNGEWMKLNGMCMHHDQGALGSVSNYRAVQRQMEILKGMGVNAIRVTHNPASDELLQVCDELGLMVIEEAFDSWFLGKKNYDYGVRFFEMEATDPTATPGQTWAEFDLKTMVNRGKNFPSIIMWSLGNEIYATDNARGPETAQKLYDWAKEIDDTRPCTMGEDKFRERSATDTTSTYIQVADKMDVVGMNYIDRYPYKYDTLRATHPDWIIYGSENSSATKSRGKFMAHPDSEGTETPAASRITSSPPMTTTTWAGAAPRRRAGPQTATGNLSWENLSGPASTTSASRPRGTRMHTRRRRILTLALWILRAS